MDPNRYIAEFFFGKDRKIANVKINNVKIFNENAIHMQDSGSFPKVDGR